MYERAPVYDERVTGGADDAERAAFDAAVARIRDMDPLDAFEAAGELVDLHQEFRGVAARLRYEQAQRAWDTGHMTITELAARLGLTKQRASQILRKAREAAAEQSTRPEPVPVVAAIVTSRKGVLVTQRRDGKPPWGFVSGEVEPGESPADAAVREVKEECGLVVRHGRIIGRRVHPATQRTLIYMTAELAGRASAPIIGDESELSDVRWVSLAEADELLPGMFEPVRSYLARTLSR